MIARLEIEGHFFRYMKIAQPVQEIRVPIPKLPNHTVSYTEDSSHFEASFIDLTFVDDGYSDIDGNRLYKLRGGIC